MCNMPSVVEVWDEVGEPASYKYRGQCAVCHCLGASRVRWVSQLLIASVSLYAAPPTRSHALQRQTAATVHTVATDTAGKFWSIASRALCYMCTLGVQLYDLQAIPHSIDIAGVFRSVSFYPDCSILQYFLFQKLPSVSHFMGTVS